MLGIDEENLYKESTFLGFSLTGTHVDQKEFDH
jgi:hypothetical protein